MTDSEAGPFRWEDYFKATARRPPHATAERGMAALTEGWAKMPSEVRVLDLGCGTGRDTLHFLARGWNVTAVDSHPSALAELEERAAELKVGAQLVCVGERFEQLELEPASFDLINASMALPFCEPGNFKAFWELLRKALRPHGVFAGHFFGKHDEWVSRNEMTFLWLSELEGLLMGLETVHLAEHELDRATPQGELKHWHYFEVVARKH